MDERPMVFVGGGDDGVGREATGQPPGEMPKEMSVICEQCGFEIPEGPGLGRCPRCLLRSALTEEEQDLDPPVTDESPGPDESTFFPRMFGDFVLLEVLGRGGMGIVYRARHKVLEREVAVKMILEGRMADETTRARFVQETRLVASLNHPNIVTLFDVGACEDQLFYSMELVRGTSLSQAAEIRPFTAIESARMMFHLAQAIQYAHDQGVIHRDINPRNVLIAEADRPLLADFGLATRIAEETSLTVSGQLLGTPGFWPPERLEGTGTFSPAGDIYGLGGILYFLLCGRPPFVAEGMEALLVAVAASDPIPPRTLKPGLSVDLETICLKCLERDPARRYASAGEIALEIRRWLDGEPIRARPAGSLSKTVKWVRRQPAMAALTLLLVATFLTGLFLSTYYWRRAENHASRLAHVVDRLQLDRAESRLQSGRPGEGMAILASLLRENPANETAAARAASLLLHRPFITPDSWRGTDRPFGWLSAFARHNQQLIISTNEGRTLTHWDMESEPRLLTTIDVGEVVRLTTFSRGGDRLLIATEEKNLILLDLTDGSPVAGPFLLDEFAVQLHLSPDTRTAVIVTVPDFRTDNHHRTHGKWLRLSDGQFLHEDQTFHWADLGPDGLRALTVDESQVDFRDPESWDRIGTLILGESRINTAIFGPDSERIVTADASGNARIWEARSGREIQRLPHDVALLEAWFSPDGSRILTRDLAGQARLWDWKAARIIGSPFTQSKGLGRDSFSSGGGRIIGFGSSGLVLFDAMTGASLAEPVNLGDSYIRVRFLADGKRLISTTRDGSVRLWNLPPRDRLSHVFMDAVEVADASFSPDESKVATGIKGSWAHVWTIGRSGDASGRMQHRRTVKCVNWSPDGHLLATASFDHTARLWDADSSEQMGQTMKHSGPVRWCEFSPDGRWIATASEDGTAFLWSVPEARPQTGPLRHEDRVFQARFSPDGTLLATASSDGTIGLWSVPDGSPVGRLRQDRGMVARLDFSPDGQRLATCGADRTARIWDLSSGELAIAPIEHVRMISDIQFDPSGSRVVTASSDGTARIWDAETGAPSARPLRHQGSVKWAGFSPDGRWVLTVSSDRTAMVWDASNGHQVSDPLRHGARVITGRWSQTGRKLLTGSYDRSVKVWSWWIPSELPVPDWFPDLLEARAGLKLSGDELFEPLTIAQVLEMQARTPFKAGDDPWSAWLRHVAGP